MMLGSTGFEEFIMTITIVGLLLLALLTGSVRSAAISLRRIAQALDKSDPQK
ncbi:MAG: hypothetical protein ABFD92_04720 [Planctomycetaceae bacterium]|nr:hypothetical protein [Planctomycetaceae bacterium]